MARQRFTANDVVRFLECDDDEPMMQDSDDEDSTADLKALSLILVGISCVS